MASARQHILVVEDDATLSQVIRFKLAKAGFEVDLADNGQEALTMLAERAYDLVVTDEMMPYVTGRQLCERMQNEPSLSAIPVVMLTVKALELDPVELRRTLGVIELHPKPFSPTVLLRSIQRVLDSHGAAARAARTGLNAREPVTTA